MIAPPSIGVVAFLPMFPFVLWGFLLGGRTSLLLLLLGLATGLSVKAVTLLEQRPKPPAVEPVEPLEGD